MKQIVKVLNPAVIITESEDGVKVEVITNFRDFDSAVDSAIQLNEFDGSDSYSLVVNVKYGFTSFEDYQDEYQSGGKFEINQDDYGYPLTTDWEKMYGIAWFEAKSYKEIEHYFGKFLVESGKENHEKEGWAYPEFKYEYPYLVEEIEGNVWTQINEYTFYDLFGSLPPARMWQKENGNPNSNMAFMVGSPISHIIRGPKEDEPVHLMLVSFNDGDSDDGEKMYFAKPILLCDFERMVNMTDDVVKL